MEDSIAELEERAMDGDAEAALELADRFMNGDGVDQNDGLSSKWYRKATEQGHSDAQCNLGWMYENGRGVEQNDVLACTWYRKAAEQGNSIAQCNLGLMYENGRGVEQNSRIAFFWIERAAKQGYAMAQHALGKLYALGEGVMQSYEAARFWLEKPAMQGNPDAMFDLGQSYYMDKSNDQNERFSFYWFMKAMVQSLEQPRQTAPDGRRFEAEYETARKHLQEAKEMLSLGKANLSLISARSCLEFCIKKACVELGVEADIRVETTEHLIDMLAAAGIFDRQEISQLHQARKECNRGAHVELDRPDCTVDEAQRAYQRMTDILEMFRTKHQIYGTGRNPAAGNMPMNDDDYYDRRSGRFGKWARCYSREELLSMPEYIQLFSRAENGDISAMQDIAVDFLSERSTWNGNGLINYPPFTVEGRVWNQDQCFDTRYYFWILSAANAAARSLFENRNWEAIPKRHLATMLLEALKYSFFTGTAPNYVCVVKEERLVWDYLTERRYYQPVFTDPFDLVAAMFGQTMPFGDLREYAMMLLALMMTYTDRRIVSPLHYEQKPEHIKYLLYCSVYYCRLDTPENIKFQSVEPWFALANVDIGQSVDIALLEARCLDGVCSAYYQYITQQCRRLQRKTDRKEKRKTFTEFTKSFL